MGQEGDGARGDLVFSRVVRDNRYCYKGTESPTCCHRGLLQGHARSVHTVIHHDGVPVCLGRQVPPWVLCGAQMDEL